jgi:hypothetical protein
LLFTGVLAAATTQGCLDYDDDDPERWPAKPVSNWDMQDARAFDEFELYWLGDSYEGLALTSMRTYTDGDMVRHATFAYGEPKYTGDAASGSWISPLEIDIQPYCGFSPKEYLSYERFLESEIEQIEVRGVGGYTEVYSENEDFGYLHLWTGSSHVGIDTWKTSFDIEKAARDLIPMSQDTGTSEGAFPPPTSEQC